MKLQPLLAVVGIALFLYWVVQDPVSAANVIHHLFTWVVGMVQLIANRVVTFLGVLAK
jgi:hypothetical protein